MHILLQFMKDISFMTAAFVIDLLGTNQTLINFISSQKKLCVKKRFFADFGDGEGKAQGLGGYLLPP